MAGASRCGRPAGLPLSRPAAHGRDGLLEAGEPDHVVEAVTGHLSRRMLEHYSHIRLNAKKAALDRLDQRRSRLRSRPKSDTALASPEPLDARPSRYPERFRLTAMDADTHAWRELDRDELGFLNTLSGVFAAAQRRDPECLPNLRGADCLFVGSDYGGEHQNANYLTLTFLIADVAACARWAPVWAPWRRRFLPDRRRMVYKEPQRRPPRPRVVPTSRNREPIAGPSYNIRVLSGHPAAYFLSTGSSKHLSSSLRRSARLPAPVAEKFMRVVHVLSLLLAGLSAPGQDVLWVTDEDSIAANPARVRHLSDALAFASSRCLTHNLRHLRVATAETRQRRFVSGGSAGDP